MLHYISYDIYYSKIICFILFSIIFLLFTLNLDDLKISKTIASMIIIVVGDSSLSSDLKMSRRFRSIQQ